MNRLCAPIVFLALSTGTCLGAQAVSYYMTKDAPPLCSNPIGSPPARHNSLLTTDASARLWFTLSAASPAVSVSSWYYDPSGNLYEALSGALPPPMIAGGLACYVDVPFAIAGQFPSTRPGLWEVAIFYGDDYMFTLEFTISPPGSGGGGTGGGCTYTINPGANSIPAAGGPGSVSITAQPGCVWSATSNAAFIAIPGVSAGNGNGAFGYSVAANTGTTARSGTITVAGLTHTVSQAAAAGGDGGGVSQGPLQSAVINSRMNVYAASRATTTGFGGGLLPYSYSFTAQPGHVLTISSATGLTHNQGGALSFPADGVQFEHSFPPVNGISGISSFSAYHLIGVFLDNSTPSGTPPASLDFRGATGPQFTELRPQLRQVFFIGDGRTGFQLREGSSGAYQQFFVPAGATRLFLGVSDAQGFFDDNAGSLNIQFSIGAPSGGGGGTACTYSLNPSSGAIPSPGGTGTFQAITQAGCAWTATSGASYVTVTSGASGTGSGVVAYSVAANAATTARSGAITAGGQTFTINQAAAQPCTFTVNPATIQATGGASSPTIQVTASGSSCTWTASTTTPWISTASGSSGTGNGTVTLSLQPNTTAGPRNGTVTVAGQTIAVTQAALPCTFTVAPSSVSAPAAGGQPTIQVTPSNSACAWTAATSTSWLSIASGAGGTGSGTVTLAVQANPAPSERTGTVTVAGQTITVTQAAVACTFTINPASISHGPAGASSSIQVTASNSACPWTAATSTPWLSIASGASGTGNGTVSIAVQANSTGSDRTGSVTIGGQTLAVSQVATCAFTLSRTSIAAPPAGASFLVTVTANHASCPWSATSATPWININAGTGAGNGSFNVSVGENLSVASRSGSVTIAGQSIPVTQNGQPCTLTVSPRTVAAPQTGGPLAIQVTADTTTCPWTAVTTTPWIGVPATFTSFGSGSVTLTLQPNTTGSDRTGTATVGEQTVTVTQSGTVCTFTFTPAGITAPPGAGNGRFDFVASNSACPWTASTGASWIRITSAATGTGNGSVSFAFDALSGGPPRAGSITIGSSQAAVNQLPGGSGSVTGSVRVDGKANIFGAGHSVPPAPGGGGGGLLPPWWRIAAGPGKVVTFTPNGDDGGLAPTDINSWGGISGLLHRGRAFPLAGVFLGDAEPADPAPPRPDFTRDDFAILQPELGQTFFIGDGLIGNGSGNKQQFLVPPGATRVFLGFPDACGNTGNPGCYDDNSGARDVSFDITSSSCSYSISPMERTIPGTAGQGNVAVTTGTACPWSAMPPGGVPWLQLTPPAGGSGSGAFTYSAEANTGAERRTEITVAGLRHTIIQSAPSSGGSTGGNTGTPQTTGIDAKSNIFAAGRTTTAGFGGGLLPYTFRFTPQAGQTLTFSSVTGLTHNGGGSPSWGPDGVQSGNVFTAVQGISGIASIQSMNLVGVFLDDATPANPAPASLDFRPGALGMEFTELRPLLRQTFFIGDGRNTAGAIQQFIVPAGATRLFLGFADAPFGQSAPASYDDNNGSLNATFTIAGPGGSTGGSTGGGAGTPAFTRNGVTAAPLVTAGPIAAGSLFTIRGSNLGPQPDARALNYPLQNVLEGVSIRVTRGNTTVNALPIFAGFDAIHAVMPSNAPLGEVEITVTRGLSASTPVTVLVDGGSFNIFSLSGDGKGPGVFQDAAGDPIGRTRPAKTRESVRLLGTGLGPLLDAPDNQAPSPAAALPLYPLDVLVGGAKARVIRKARSPFSPGVDVIEFEIPPSAPGICSAPVQVVSGTRVSNTVTIPIAAAGEIACEVNPEALAQ